MLFIPARTITIQPALTLKNENSDCYSHAKKYLNYHGENIVFELIRAAYASVANIVVIPMQDILNLGGEARMNFPGKLGGNWTWRMKWEQIPHTLTNTYKNMAELYERPQKPQKEEEIENLNTAGGFHR